MVYTDDDGDSCFLDEYSTEESDEDSSLDGWIVPDDCVEYVDLHDEYLDDAEEVPKPKKRRIIRPEPETDEECDPLPPTRCSKWVIHDEDEPVAVEA